MSRAARLLSLIQALRRRSRPVTAAVLADELGVSERTLYRDIAELTAQGAPIQGEAGIGYVLGPGLFLPPLMLSEDETEAVVLGLRYVRQRGDEIVGRAAADALAKIEAVLSPAALEALRNPTVLPGPPGPGFPANAVALSVLRAAIRGQTKLRIDYADRGGARTRRIVWPLALGLMNESRILVAWCETRDGYRHFRTDRIAAAEDAKARYPGRRSTLLQAWRAALDGDAARRFTPDKV